MYANRYEELAKFLDLGFVSKATLKELQKETKVMEIPEVAAVILRWQVGILGYLIAEMKTSKHTNKQKYRLRLFNFSTLRRREIFIFINEECGIHVRTPCIVLRLIDGRETRPRLYTPTSSSFVSPYGFGTREHSSRYHGFVCQRQKPLGYEREARVIKVFSQKNVPFCTFSAY